MLFRLYFGNNNDESVMDNKRLPGNMNLKLRVIAYLRKSVLATNEFLSVITVCDDAFFGMFFLIA